MVAGKVRAAMGLQKSLANPHRSNKPSETTPPPPPAKPTPPPLPSPSTITPGSKPRSHCNKQNAVFSRSFGVYFPRTSAQVQPRPPDVAELLRLVEELRDRESRLKTELLEFKILKETASIVPVLESKLSNKIQELDRAAQRIEILERENQSLRAEAEEMRVKMEESRMESEKRVEEMEREILELKKTVSEKGRENEELSSSQRFQGLVDLASKSSLIRSLKRVKCTDVNITNNESSSGCVDKPLETGDCKRDQTTSLLESSEREKPRHSRCNSEDFLPVSMIRSRAPRVPKPPPKPSSLSSSTLPTTGSNQLVSSPPLPPPPPPPPPPPCPAARKVAPPPLPPNGLRVAAAKVTRVPEVVEFYHSLMKRDSRRESNGAGGGGGGGGGGAVEVVLPVTANARDMIGEIENRSAHLLAVSIPVHG